MAKESWISDNGQWRQTKEKWVANNTTWVKVREQFVNDNGTWRLVYVDPPLQNNVISTNISYTNFDGGAAYARVYLQPDGSIDKNENLLSVTRTTNGAWVESGKLSDNNGPYTECRIVWSVGLGLGPTSWVPISSEIAFGEFISTGGSNGASDAATGTIYVRKIGDATSEISLGSFNFSVTSAGTGGGGEIP